MEVLLQKSSLTLTAIALVPVLAMAFSLTVPGIVSDVATVTKGAGPWRSVNYGHYFFAAVNIKKLQTCERWGGPFKSTELF